MSTTIDAKAEDFSLLWADEELRSYIVVLQTIFEAAMFSQPKKRLRTIVEHPEPLKEGGHEYTAFLWEREENSEYTLRDPTPPGHSHRWKQFVMTYQCDFFAELMEDIVRIWARKCFGDATEVHWLHHVPKPDSILIPTRAFGPQPKHSVLSITLPHENVYIYDGTGAQYGRDFLLLPKGEYADKYVRCAGQAEPFWSGDATGVEMRESVNYDYDFLEDVLETIEETLDNLDWNQYRGAYEEVVIREITALATPAFTWMH